VVQHNRRDPIRAMRTALCASKRSTVSTNIMAIDPDWLPIGEADIDAIAVSPVSRSSAAMADSA